MRAELDDPELVAEFRRGRGPGDLEQRYRAFRAGRLTNLLLIFAPIVLVFNILQFTRALDAPWSADFIARLAFMLYLTGVILSALFKFRAGSLPLVLSTLFMFICFASLLQFLQALHPPPEGTRPFPYLLLAAAGVYFFSAGGWKTYALLFLPATLVLVLALATLVDLPAGFWSSGGIPAGTGVVILLGIATRGFMERSKRSEYLALEMSAANRRLRALDKLKDDFLARTSHALRAPLQGIIGIAEAMDGNSVGQTTPAAGDPELIAHTGRGMLNLIDDLLDHTRLKHGDIRLEIRPVDLRVMTRVVLDLHRAAGEKKVELRNEIPANLPAVPADENRLRQILHNLVDNAVRYGEGTTIRVHARKHGDYVMVSVSDQGPGIPPARRATIFHSFEDGANEEQTQAGPGPGTGMGLSISRRLVELHGGEMGVDDEPGGGSRFYFILPLGIAETKPRPDHSEPVPAESMLRETITPSPVAAKSGGAKHAPDESARRILVVDDEALHLRVIQGHLENNGYAVVTAAGGREALEILDGDGPAVQAVILDLMMPGLSGFDTARAIREKHGRLELPILITANRAGRKDLFAALNAGANDYIPKPVEPAPLLLRLDALLLLAEQHLAGISFEREHEESLRRERQRLLTDLHDHLGAQLTDVRIAAEALISQGDAARNQDTLRNGIKRAGEMLREEMQLIDDLDLLDENFLAGTQLMLLRRYSSAARELDFHAPMEIEDLVHRGLGKNGRSVMHAVTRETATNDLKYGYGPSNWRVSLEGSRLHLEMSSATNYSPEHHGTGRGTEHLIRRVTELGGEVNITGAEEDSQAGNLKGDLIRIRIEVPLKEIPPKEN